MIELEIFTTKNPQIKWLAWHSDGEHVGVFLLGTLGNYDGRENHFFDIEFFSCFNNMNRIRPTWLLILMSNPNTLMMEELSPNYLKWINKAFWKGIGIDKITRVIFFCAGSVLVCFVSFSIGQSFGLGLWVYSMPVNYRKGIFQCTFSQDRILDF